jgi:hypothetical protein
MAAGGVAELVGEVDELVGAGECGDGAAGR